MPELYRLTVKNVALKGDNSFCKHGTHGILPYHGVYAEHRHTTMDVSSFREITGVSAGLLAFAACPIYVYSILKGETKPSRVTWWILLLGSGILAASYWANGARETIWIPLAYCANYAIAAILSLKYGAGSTHLSTLDIICLLGAMISIVLWWFTSNPLIALTLQMILELFALTPTLIKVYREPESESALAWGIAVIASLVNLLAISSWDYGIAAYPLFVVVTNIPIAFLAFQNKFTMRL